MNSKKTPFVRLKESPIDEFESLGVKPASFDFTGARPPIPQDFSICDEMTSVKNQGQQGSCTSFAVTACLEFIYKKSLSEAQVQHESEKSFGDCDPQGGLALVHAFRTCTRRGAIEESNWPYDSTKVCWDNPPDTTGKKRHKFHDFGTVYRARRASVVGEAIRVVDESTAFQPSVPRLDKTVAVQQQLFYRRQPVCVEVPVITSDWFWNNTGDIPMPTPNALREHYERLAAPLSDDWHAVAICGWISSRRAFYFQEQLGQLGRFRIRYDPISIHRYIQYFGSRWLGLN